MTKALRVIIDECKSCTNSNNVGCLKNSEERVCVNERERGSSRAKICLLGSKQSSNFRKSNCESFPLELGKEPLTDVDFSGGGRLPF